MIRMADESETKTKAEKLAQSAFKLGMTSVFCGVTTIPAIIQSIRAIICIQKERASKLLLLKVLFGLIFAMGITTCESFFVTRRFPLPKRWQMKSIV
jgi:hypothetical protein